MAIKIFGVFRSGVAYKNGIRDGDVLKSVNNVGIFTPKALTTILKSVKPHSRILIETRDKGEFYITTAKHKKRAGSSLGVILDQANAKKYLKELEDKAAAKSKEDTKNESVAAKPKKSIFSKKSKEPEKAPKTDEDKAVVAAANEAKVDALITELGEHENYFVKKARDEVEALNARLNDMRGADAYLAASRMRHELEKENIKLLNAAGDRVSKYLNKMANRDIEDTKPAKRKLSKLGKIVVGIGGFAVTAAAITGVVYGLVL